MRAGEVGLKLSRERPTSHDFFRDEVVSNDASREFQGRPIRNTAETGNVDDSLEKLAPMTFNWLPTNLSTDCVNAGIRTHGFKLFRVGWSSAHKTHALEFFFDFLKGALFRQACRLIETPPM